MQALTVACAFVLSATVLAAQTIESTLDLSALGWGPIETPIAVETDGDLTSREWLIAHTHTGQWRIVAERPGRLCVGQWFSPLFGGTPFDTIAQVQRVGMIHKVVIRRIGSDVVTMVRLDTPAC